MIFKYTIFPLISLLLYSAVQAAEYDLIPSQIDAQLSSIIKANELTGSPISEFPIPDIDSPKAQLGMKLFYSKSLGGDKTTACVSCHHPMLGGGDNLSLSIGIDSINPDVLGPHRKLQKNTSPQVPRNAPTTFNVTFWKKSMFHDMRITRLSDNSIHTPDMPYPETDPLAGDTLVQAQARFPITSINEMRGAYKGDSFNQTLRRELAARLKNNWLEEFQKGFSFPTGSAEDLITEQNFSEAIAEFERSQVFINTPWKSYVEGNLEAINESAKQGAVLFYTAQQDGGAACSQCHSGDFFTDELAYNTAMPQIGVGLESGSTKTNDYGLNLVTNKEDDKFRFRTPSLLNVEVTGPWGHDGGYTSLEGITTHMLSPIKSALHYNPKQLKQDNIATQDTQENTLEAIEAGVNITAKPSLEKNDVKYIVAFLKTLTDPCVKDRACLSKWILPVNENDPDGQTLHAISNTTGKYF